MTVNTDDPKMFGNSTAEELYLVEHKLGFTRDETRSLILQGIQASWLSTDRKQRMIDAFRRDPAWQGECLTSDCDLLWCDAARRAAGPTTKA